MTISELVKVSGEVARLKGFQITGPEEIDKKLLLTVGELVEAQNELRNGHGAQEIYDGGHVYDITPAGFVQVKPEGFPIELADAVIRIAQLCDDLEIDLEAAIELKTAYNRTRPFKHGKQF